MQQVADPFSANAITQENLQSLVQDGRVHSRAYTNQAIFDLEIDRIFHRSWIYVGHESEVPKPGDYQARPIGRTPVILVRGKDNKVRVLVNRCRHRGAQVVQTESGNTRMFRCWYHGWTYELTGALAEVTEKGGYGPDFKTENMGLVEVPRVASHRGFVFASIKAQGESLAEFLGGQLLVIVVMVLFYSAALWLANLEFALPIGVITGGLVFIPYVGAFIGTALGTVAALLQFDSFTGVLFVWIAFGAGQALEGMLVTPMLVGKRIGLHPVAVIFALLAFGQVFGFFGVLLALPASAALLVGMRHMGAAYLASPLYGKSTDTERGDTGK